MLRHVVMFRWKADVTEEQMRAVEDGLGALPTAIPEVKRYQFGRDAGLSEGNFDFVIVADFNSLRDYETYQGDPRHLDVVHRHIKNAVSARVGAQYWLNDAGGERRV